MSPGHVMVIVWFVWYHNKAREKTGCMSLVQRISLGEQNGHNHIHHNRDLNS